MRRHCLDVLENPAAGGISSQYSLVDSGSPGWSVNDKFVGISILQMRTKQAMPVDTEVDISVEIGIPWHVLWGIASHELIPALVASDLEVQYREKPMFPYSQ
jgi:hypothetical protein